MREFTEFCLHPSQIYIAQISALLVGRSERYWDGDYILTESAMVQFANTHSAAAFVTASLWH